MTGTQPETDTETRPFDREAVRAAVIDAALPHVPFDGWTQAVLQQGAADAGYEKVMALRVFPGGPVEAIGFWSKLADRRMLEELERRDLAGMKVRERIATAVRMRLEQNMRHREAVRRALSMLAMPLNAGQGPALLWRTVDAIWYAAGDTATDFNYYTKRGLLAGVYSATVLYWLDDRSEGSENTWSFLDRRIADVMRVPQTLGSIGKRLSAFPSPFSILRAGPFARR
jgi:ubiquinone biosynthesis protein COQ9